MILALLFAAAAVVPPDGIIHVRHGLTKAHACAVAADVMLTAAHVTDEGGMFLAWSDLAGHDGTAEWDHDDPARDLSVLRVTRGRPARVWPIAKVAPKVGDRLRIVGYKDDKPAEPKVVEAKVIDIDAGHIDYSNSPGFGSSGDCVLNDADEVVAINHAVQLDGAAVRWGVGVAVYGEWAPKMPEVDKPKPKPVVLRWLE